MGVNVSRVTVVPVYSGFQSIGNVEIYRTYYHNGDYYSGTNVGFNYDSSPIQYPDHWGTNDRIVFKTDQYGASSITVSGLTVLQTNEKRTRFIVNQSLDTYLKGSLHDGVAIQSTGTATLEIKLSPNTQYVLWICCDDWSDRLNDSNITITASGGYGTKGLPSASNNTFGSSIAITISGGTQGATYTVTISLAGKTETLQTNNASTSLTWVPSVATYAPLITSSNSAQATITCETFYAGVSIGTATKIISVSFGSNSLPPTVSSGWVTASPYNTGSVSSFTVYVQGYSKIHVDFDSSKIECQYGASISSYKIVCDGTEDSTSPYVTQTITGTSATVSCYVYDSRGHYAKTDLSVSLYSYSKPTLSNVSVYRSDTDGNAKEDGTCISTLATKNFSSCNNQNSCSLKVYIRTSSGTYGPGVEITSGSRRVFTDLDPNTTYEVKIVAQDTIGNKEEAVRGVHTIAWAMKFRPDGRGVAFGKAAESSNSLDLASGWVFSMRDSNGNAVTMNVEQLRSLLQLLE